MLGDRVPKSLKIFLVSLAIFDDLGAIIVIAVFYTETLSLGALLISSVWLLNKAEVVSKSAYLMVGVVMWGSLLQSGGHATLAGVILALFIPMQGTNWESQKLQPLRELEHDLDLPVGLIVLPLFAFTNAGLSFSQLGFSDIPSRHYSGIICRQTSGCDAGRILGY